MKAPKEAKAQEPAQEVPAELSDALDQYEAQQLAEGRVNPQRLAQTLATDVLALYVDPKTAEVRPKRHVARAVSIYTTSIGARVRQIAAEQNEDPTNSPEMDNPEILAFLTVLEEILSNPLDRQKFARGQGSIARIRIDPVMITNTMLTDLGLTQFIPPKGTHQAEAVAFRAQAIDSIKTMLQHIEPISTPTRRKTNLRLTRIGAGENEGEILGTRTVDGKKVFFKVDLHGASRSLKHTDSNYDDEIEILNTIKDILKHARENLEVWQKLSEEERMEIRKTLLDAVNKIKKARNEQKLALKDKIEKALSFQAENGTEDPAEIQANLGVALDHLEARVGQINDIFPHLASDRIKVAELTRKQMAKITEFVLEVEEGHDTAISQEELPLIEEKLDRFQALCLEQKFEPYLSFGRKFSAQIDKVRTALQAKDKPTAAREFTKAYLISKLEWAYMDLMAVYEGISLRPHQQNPEKVLEELERIYTNLVKNKEYGVAPEIDTKEYTPAFVEFYHLINSLKKRLREITPDSPKKGEQAPTTPKSRLDAVLEKLENLPKIGQIVSKVRSLIQFVYRSVKPAKIAPKPVTPPSVAESQTPEPSTTKSKQQAFKEMKKRVSDFDFRALAQSLP